jgi:alpha/beta superfamily hydrolase
MDNNVVQPIARSCARRGFTALTFNFRGVGASGGHHGGGNEEPDDLEAALAYLRVQPEMAAKPLGAAGYSFGGQVALKLALRSSMINALALVSPASALSDLLHLATYPKPWLYISGGQDPHIPPQHAALLKEKAGRLGNVILKASADHLWWDEEQEVADRIAVFMEEALTGISNTPAN